MDIPLLPARAEFAVPLAPAQAKVPKRAMSTQPETAQPVLAAPQASLPAPIKGLGVARLDMYQVGDSDEQPVPPEPPRKPAFLTVADPPEDADDVAAASDDPRPEPAAPAAATPQAGPELPKLMQELDRPAANPTVDIRR